jgi:flavin-dependent dehydrogenase
MRGYFRLDRDLEEDPCLEIHLDRGLLPHYGWLFPVDERTVNVGVGADRNGQEDTGLRAAFREFVSRNPKVRERLDGAIPEGLARGWPTHTGFLACRTYDDGVLVVGEAAGLVDPLTGEGIAFALQSGELAAATACEAFSTGDFSASRLSSYGLALRRRFSPYFRYTQRLRSLLSNPELADALVALARRTKATRAGRWALRPTASLVRFAIERRRVLGTAPYLAYRLLRARARSIEL